MDKSLFQNSNFENEDSLFLPIPLLNDDSIFNYFNDNNERIYTPGIPDNNNLINIESSVSNRNNNDNYQNLNKVKNESDYPYQNNKIENTISKFDFSTIQSTEINLTEKSFLFGKKKNN